MCHGWNTGSPVSDVSGSGVLCDHAKYLVQIEDTKDMLMLGSVVVYNVWLGLL